MPTGEVGVVVRADGTWQKVGLAPGVLVLLAGSTNSGTWSMYDGGIATNIQFAWGATSLAMDPSFSQDGLVMSVTTAAGGHQSISAKVTGNVVFVEGTDDGGSSLVTDAATDDSDADATTSGSDADSGADGSDADASASTVQPWTSCQPNDSMSQSAGQTGMVECCGGIWTPWANLWSGVACSTPSNTECFDNAYGTNEFGFIRCCGGVWGAANGAGAPACWDASLPPPGDTGALTQLTGMLNVDDAGHPACLEASLPDASSCCPHVACIESDSGACPAWPDVVPGIAQEHATVWGSCYCGGTLNQEPYGPFDPATAAAYAETPADARGSCCYVVYSQFCQ